MFPDLLFWFLLFFFAFFFAFWISFSFRIRFVFCSWSILGVSHKGLALAAHQSSKVLLVPFRWVGKDKGALVPPSRVIRGLQKCIHATSTLPNASL